MSPERTDQSSTILRSDPVEPSKEQSIDLEPMQCHEEHEEESICEGSVFINREISWVRFNQRVLEEAMDTDHPLLERVKFLAICGSNLDEFFMCRLSRVRKKHLHGSSKISTDDDMSPQEVIEETRQLILDLGRHYDLLWSSDILPALAKEGIRILTPSDLTESQKDNLRTHFREKVYPTLTPLAIDVAHPFPFISNMSLSLAVVLEGLDGKRKLARVRVNSDLFPRFIEIPQTPVGVTAPPCRNGPVTRNLISIEDLTAMNLDLLFPNITILGSYQLRVTRDAEIAIVPDEYHDLLVAVKQGVKSRRTGRPIRLEVSSSMPRDLRDFFAKNLELTEDFVYTTDTFLGYVDLWQLKGLDRPDLKDVEFQPHIPKQLREEMDLFTAIRQRDWLLYHPYDDFTIIVNLLRQAALDPMVLAIKITLYRIDKRSPVIDALIEARQNGKNVAVLVELKAKFDEENNINWARALENAGVHVIYGLPDLKVHIKLLLIVRKEGDSIVHYSHLSSGNYNTITSRIYGDIGYLTSNPTMGVEVRELFNTLTGYSNKDDYHHLLVAPKALKTEIVKRIQREVETHRRSGGGYILFKLNGLVERKIISELYRASRSGVRIDLNVRGLCCLVPGIKNLSETITVNSIVGRFLEHTRIYYFRNGGDEEILLGSSDMMPRNLKKRVEVLFSIPEKRLIRPIMEHILWVHLNDTVKSRLLQPDCTYVRARSAPGRPPLNSQSWLIEHRGIWHEMRG